MFKGTYRHSLDSAGRFVMPLELRLELGKEFCVFKGMGCLCVSTRDWVFHLADEIGKLGNCLDSLLDPDIARLSRHFYSGLVETGTDKQSRVQLTSDHRGYAGIEDEVVIRGCGDHIEIWSARALDDYEKQNDGVNDLFASYAALKAQSGRGAPGDDSTGVPQTGSG